jgi:hypothetical protein
MKYKTKKTIVKWNKFWRKVSKEITDSIYPWETAYL